MTKAAVVSGTNSVPTYKEVTLAAPLEDEVTVKVVAVGYSHLVRGRASGQHYSVSGAGDQERLVGVDGVGYIGDELVFFVAPEPHLGAYGQHVNVKKANVFPFPKGHTDADAIGRVAALNNGAMSSLLAFARVKLPQNFTVAILGVTGTSGQLAIQVAKLLGAKKVIGIARSSLKLDELKQKQPLLDEVVSYEQDDKDIVANSSLHEADVVLDYIWGESTTRFIANIIAARKVTSKALYWIEIGQIGGPTVELPGGLFRGNNFILLGSGLGPLDNEEFGAVMTKVAHYLAKGDLTGDYKALKIEQVLEEWTKPWDNLTRSYFTISHD